MNIALYGVSRSGKNYLIERLIESINGKVAKTLFHVDGSGILDKLSNNKFGIPLRDTNENQKKQLRLMFYDEFAVLGNDYSHKIIDAHYCFYKNDSFRNAFTNKDRDVNDTFFYLDTPANVIIEQANRDIKKKDIAFMTEKEINVWKEFEIQSLRDICLNNNKEFVVLDNNIEDCIDYFETLLLRTRDVLLDSKKIAKYIITKHQKLIDEYKNIILIDCDRTISDNDTTYDFYSSLGIDKQKLKNIFCGEHYTLYQFFRVAKLYAEKDMLTYEDASTYAMGKAVLNMPLIEDIKHNGLNYLSIGITSGILRTWEKLQEKYRFPCIITGGSNINVDKIIISREVKYQLVKNLKKKGKYVIAVGDSMVDIDMLNEADKGFVVAQNKINETINAYFKSVKTKIMQLNYNKLQYDDIASKRSIFYEHNLTL
jgi:hydrogenase maturation factor